MSTRHPRRKPKKSRPYKGLSIRTRSRGDAVVIEPNSCASLDFAGHLPTVTIWNKGPVPIYVRGCV